MDTSESMIERVARALVLASRKINGPTLQNGVDVAFARAAIEAIREPNMAMAEALGRAIQKPGADEGVVRCDPGLAANVWYRMIDAALANP